ncbi:uncharacterized protein [Amphiura filiformis]|uniref:uncharacterized protein n=1 Tax=Amphiura filiformis TaxID=82378 RepID=UPI003B214EC4
MMKITLVALVISAGILTSCNVNAKYRKQGNHWFEDGTVPNSKEDNERLADQGTAEFEELFMDHDAAAIAEKYTEDCVFMHQDLGILQGREAVREAYQSMFDSGKYSVVVEADGDSGAMLENRYMQVISALHYFDKDNNSMGVSRMFFILKPVEGGYETHRTAEFTVTE